MGYDTFKQTNNATKKCNLLVLRRVKLDCLVEPTAFRLCLVVSLDCSWTNFIK